MNHDAIASNLTFSEAVRQATGTNLARCYQCGKCSAGCPMAEEMTLRTHDLMRLAGRDERDRLLDSEAIWLCLTCEACTARCPNGCDPARVIDHLRELALAEGRAAAPRSIRAFHAAFLKQIRVHGRVFETGLVVGYKLRSGRLFSDVLAAPAMMKRGKLGLRRVNIRGREELARIFEACLPSRPEPEDEAAEAPAEADGGKGAATAGGEG